MKGIWKIFEFEKFDTLACLTVDKAGTRYEIEITLCVSIGNMASISMSFDTLEAAKRNFGNLSKDSVLMIANSLIEALGGDWIFEDNTMT